MTKLIENISDKYTARYSYTAAGLVEYIGYALPGADVASAVWQIRKHTYDGTNIIATGFASGNDVYDKIWDNRTSYAYK